MVKVEEVGLQFLMEFIGLNTQSLFHMIVAKMLHGKNNILKEHFHMHCVI